MKKTSKTIAVLLILLVTAATLCSCFDMFTPRSEIVIRTLGDYEKEEYYSSGGFQDYTDYGKYYYSEVPNFEGNEYFAPVCASDIEVLYGYIDNFDNWIKAIAAGASSENEKALVKNYDLDRAVITESDYFYIYDRMGEPIGESQYEQYEDYDVYIFDVESCILYFFHNNI